MTTTHVLIIGAGVCGLAIAHGLQKAGIAFTIFDAEDESAFRPREWTMALHWSIPLLKELLPDDLAQRLETDAVVDPNVDYKAPPWNVVGVFDGVSGDLVKEIPSGGIRVSRRRLRNLCREQVEIQFDHRLQGIRYRDGGVSANFANGKTYDGTIVVGADGARSTVREHMFPGHAENTAMDLVYTNITISYGDAERACFIRRTIPLTSTVYHPDSAGFISVQDARDHQQPENWVFQIVLTWKGARIGISKDIHAEVKKRAEKLTEPFRSAFLWIPDDVELRCFELGYWIPPLDPWPCHDGRVTLAGDSCHPMPPHRGQGLNNAINDAFNFVAAVKKLADDNQSQVIQGYSLEVAERGAKEVELSKSIAESMNDYEHGFRNSVFFKTGLQKVT